MLTWRRKHGHKWWPGGPPAAFIAVDIINDYRSNIISSNKAKILEVRCMNKEFV